MMRCFFVALCTLSFMCGCESTGVGNPGMTVTARSSLSPEPGATDANDPVQAELRSASLVLGEVQWIPCNSADAPVKTQGPFVVDLVSGHTTPDFGRVAIPAGGFCGFDAPLTTDASDAVMQGKSVLLAGTRADGTPFILYAAMTAKIKMRPYPSDTVWDPSNADSVIWALRPSRWVTQSEIDAESTDALGTRHRIIAIDLNRHRLLYDAIRSRLGSRSTLNTDLNGNHRLDAQDESSFIGVGLEDLD
jgi:hypothetical protein